MRLERPVQWQLVLAVLDPVEGSEQAGMRPALIVSREAINVSLSTICVVPLTTYRAGSEVFSSEVLLRAGVAGQPDDSVALAHQVRTIDVRRVIRSYGWLRDEALRERVREALRVYLDLEWPAY